MAPGISVALYSNTLLDFNDCYCLNNGLRYSTLKMETHRTYETSKETSSPSFAALYLSVS